MVMSFGKPRMWCGVDGDDCRVLLVRNPMRVMMWTNLGVWIELQNDRWRTDQYIEQTAEEYCLGRGYVEVDETIASEFAGQDMSLDELIGFGDSQEID